MTKPPAIRFLQPRGLFITPAYSHLVEVRSGRIAYISGQIALDAEGQVVGAGDFERQARQVFGNLHLALAAAGMNFSHVVKFNLYLTDMGHAPIMSRVRAEHIGSSQPPASTLIQVAGLAYPELLFEAEAIAVAADDEAS